MWKWCAAVFGSFAFGYMIGYGVGFFEASARPAKRHNCRKDRCAD